MPALARVSAALALAAALLGPAACSRPAPGRCPERPPFTGLRPAEGGSAATTASEDGVAIHHTAYGRGAPALVLVHGWSCDARYWRPVVEAFAGRHQVVTLDLAGHGESGGARERFSMEAFGADVAAVVAARGLDDVVLVGHSMGARVVLAAAPRLGARVRGVIAVDGLASAEPPGAAWRAGFAIYLFAMRHFFEEVVALELDWMFTPCTDPALERAIRADVAAAPPTVARGAIAASGRFALDAALERLEVPLATLSSDVLPLDAASVGRHARAHAAHELAGLGHFAMLEDPDRFNRQLRRAVASLAAARAAPRMAGAGTETWTEP